MPTLINPSRNTFTAARKEKQHSSTCPSSFRYVASCEQDECAFPTSHRKLNCDIVFLLDREQMCWYGKDCVLFLEKILVGDIASLEAGNGILSVITNAEGGIIDDTIITNVGGHFVMTIHDRYEAHFKEQMKLFEGEVFMEYFQHSILAVQGPGAPAVMSKLLPPDIDLERMAFMSSYDVILSGEEACRIARYVLYVMPAAF